MENPVLVVGADLRLRWANRSFYETFEVTPEDSEGSLIHELGESAWDVPQLRELLDSIRGQPGQVRSCEIERRFSASGRRTMLLRARILRQTPMEIPLILLTFEDITDRKRIEETRKTFLAETSHDVLNALNCIVGYAQLLADADLSEPVAPRILSLSAGLSALMRDLLDHSRADDKPTLDVFSARTLVRERVEAIEWRCKQKGLRLVVDLPAEGAMTTDLVKTTRILDNLLSNAVRYTPRGRIDLSGRLTDAELSVTVRDTGIGIPPEDLPRVFEQYYRAPRAKRTEPLGTGLGLSTVKRFCDLLGGTARIESAPGKGTTCTVVLPRRSPSLESTSPLGTGGTR